MLLVWWNHRRGQVDLIRVHTIWHVMHGEDVAGRVHHHRWAWGRLRRPTRALLCKARSVVCGVKGALEV